MLVLQNPYAVVAAFVAGMADGHKTHARMGRTMNMQTSNVTAPTAPKTLEAMSLSPVMMRDILIKTMFRTNLENVSAIAKAVCLPINVAQQLVDGSRDQRLCEATGTLKRQQRQ